MDSFENDISQDTESYPTHNQHHRHLNKRLEVISEASRFEELFYLVNEPETEVPNVDFNEKRVLVFLGGKNSGG